MPSKVEENRVPRPSRKLLDEKGNTSQPEVGGTRLPQPASAAWNAGGGAQMTARLLSRSTVRARCA